MLVILLIVFILMVILFCLYMYKNAHQDFVRYQQLTHDKVPAAFHGYTIFFIADLHRRLIRQETLDSIDKKIDLVCVGGDILERGVPLARVKQNIESLKRWQVPIIFVYGNNDFETDIDQLHKLLHDLDVIVLEDEIMPLTYSGDQLKIVGFRYEQECSCSKPHIDWHSLENDMTILLTHKPSSYYKLNEDSQNKIDAVFAGHTHGGQIRIFGLGPYESGSLKMVKGTAILQTEGYGCSLLPFRLGTHAECHVLTLNNTTYNHREV